MLQVKFACLYAEKKARLFDSGLRKYSLANMSGREVVTLLSGIFVLHEMFCCFL